MINLLSFEKKFTSYVDFSTHWSLSILPKNIQKLETFWYFQGACKDSSWMKWVTGKSKLKYDIDRSSPPEVFLEKAVLKIYSNFTGEHTSRSLISIKLLYNFIEIILRHECSPLNLLHIFRTPFLKDTSGGLFLYCYT